MTRARRYETPAFVVRVRPFGETSQVVHLATPEHGLVMAIAKGAHRPGPEFQGGLALGVIGTAKLSVRPGAELELLRAFRWHEGLRGLRADLERFYAACYVLDLVRTWMRPGLALPALYRAGEATLRAVNGTARGSVATWVVWFEARALAAVGLRPQLDACVECGSALGTDTVASVGAVFAVDRGGLTHNRCAAAGPTLRLGPHEVVGLQRLYTARLGDLAREPLAPSAVAAARRVHDLLVPHLLERRPRTLPAVPRPAPVGARHGA